MDTGKTCSICKEFKILLEFSKNKSKKDGLQTLCKDCAKASFKSYWTDNKEKHYSSVRKRNDAYRIKITQYCYDILKQNGCADCSEKDPIVLEFDHMRDKEFAISHMVKNCLKIERIQLEIDKCVVRCANCHRRKTAIEQGWYKNINTGL